MGPALLGSEVLLLRRVLFSLHYWVTAGRALFPGLLRKVLAVCKSLPAASLFYYPFIKKKKFTWPLQVLIVACQLLIVTRGT